MASAAEVLDHHLKSFAEGDIESMLADYSADSVLIVPDGPLKGPAAIRPIFESMISEFSKPVSTFNLLQRCIVDDHAYITWTAETAENSYELATDTFFVRNGKIAVQTFAAKLTPKG